jgi:DNA-binding transcriptional LysR family regulator
MELRDIEYFAVAAEHRHLGRAAAALGLSQPALSKSLQRLERALQAKLVKRTPKGIDLTQEGAALLLRVRELRLSLQNVAREVKEVSEGRVAHLRIGASAVTSEGFLSPVFARLLDDAPRTMLNVIVSDNDFLVPAVRSGELDAVVNFFPMLSATEGLVRERLYDDEYVVCASAKHPLAARKSVTIADVAKERWALSEPALLAPHGLFEKFREHGLSPPRVAFQSRSPRLRLRVVASSDLLDLTCRSVLDWTGPDLAVTTLPVKELTWPNAVGVIYRQEAYQSAAMRRFIEIAKIAAKNISR